MGWGPKWGFKWGVGSRASYEQGFYPNAVQDTLYLGVSANGSYSELDTDRSQESTTLSVGTDSVYEAAADASNRFNRTAPWSIEFRLEVGSVDVGYLFRYGDASVHVDLWFTANSINYEVKTSGTTYTVGKSLQLGFADVIVIALAAVPNPDTTGAADAVIYYLSVMNITQGTWISHYGIDGDTESQVSTAVFGAQDSSGTSAFDGKILAARWSEAFKSPTHSRDAFFAKFPIVATTARTRREVPIPDKASTIGNDGQFAHLYSAVSGAVAQHQMRSVGFLWSSATAGIVTLASSYQSANDPPFSDVEHYVKAPGQAVSYLSSQTLIWAPVPEVVSHVRVRVRVQLQSLAAPGPETGAITLKLYSMSRPPLSAVAPFDWDVADTTITIGYFGTPIEYLVDFGDLRIVRDGEGGSWFAIGVNGTDDDVEYRILSWTGEALSRTVTSDKFPEGLGLGNP